MSKWPAQAEISFAPINDGLIRITGTRWSAKGTETWLHSYALLGQDGVVLFEGPDRARFYEEHQQFFDDHGGLALMVLTHDGQASKGHTRALAHWDAAVMLSPRDEAAGRAKGLGDIELLPPTVASDWGFGSVHLPGHSPGFTAFQVPAGDASYLVTSHMLRQSGADGWVAFVNWRLVVEALASLEQLRDIDAGFLLVEGTNRDPLPPIPFAESDRAGVIDRALAYLRQKFGT